jgi:hypothetical protein
MDDPTDSVRTLDEPIRLTALCNSHHERRRTHFTLTRMLEEAKRGGAVTDTIDSGSGQNWRVSGCDSTGAGTTVEWSVETSHASGGTWI